MPQRAAASPSFELLGADGTGFTGRVSASGPRAAYFNPALLACAPSSATLGFFVLVERLDVNVAARSSSAACKGGACDVPAVNGAGPESFRHADGSSLEQPSLPTAWLQHGSPQASDFALDPRPRQGAGSGHTEQGYLELGLVQAPWPGRFAFGISALVPLSHFMSTSAFYSDEREQFFSNSLHHELYADRLQVMGLAFGAGVHLLDGLDAGAGLTLGIASAAHAPVYVSNLANLDTLLLDSRVDVGVSFAPHFGVAVTPVPGLRFTGTVHTPQGTRIDTAFSYVIATGIEQRASQAFEVGYLPWTFGLGAELQLGERLGTQWTFSAGTTYALWSDYLDRHAENPHGRYAFSDVLGGALGTQLRVRSYAAYVSGTFAPSPVPSQTGRTSYVDSDRLGGALGGSYDFAVASALFTLGVDVQLQSLLPRSTRKQLGAGAGSVRDEVPDDAVGGTPRGPIAGRAGLQTNNPGFPGFSSEGLLLGGGVHLRVAY